MLDDKIEAAINIFDGIETDEADEIRTFLAEVLRDRQRDERESLKWLGFMQCIERVEASAAFGTTLPSLIYNLKREVPTRYRRG